MVIPSRQRTREKRVELQKAMLDSINGTSTIVSVVHVAFLVFCFYVVLVVGETSDLDLLVGRELKLAGIDVQVSLVGFYVVAPTMVVALHINLLFQLLLLSRKIHVLIAPPGSHRPAGHWPDRLHTFPFTIGLVGHVDGMSGRLIRAVSLLTILIVPLAVVFMLQLQFLAYQSEWITWFQRLLIWLDVIAIAWLWPQTAAGKEVTLSGQLVSVLHGGRASRLRAAATAIALFCIATCLFTQSLRTWQLCTGVALGALLLLAVSTWAGARAKAGVPVPRPFEPSPDPGKRSRPSTAQRDALLVVSILCLGIVLPLALTVDGERIDRWHLYDRDSAGRQTFAPFGNTAASAILAQSRFDYPASSGTILSGWLSGFRRLDLAGRDLVPTSVPRETLSRAASADWPVASQARDSFVGLSLEKRNLRGANLTLSRLPRAKLADADLRGARLDNALVSGADMRNALLDRAKLTNARLERVDLGGSSLVFADLLSAKLSGARLAQSDLRGARVLGVEMIGANLLEADLQGLVFQEARLAGAVLNEARLDGAWFVDADLRRASFVKSVLPGVVFIDSHLEANEMVGAREARAITFREVNLAEIHGLSGGALLDLRESGGQGATRRRDEAALKLLEAISPRRAESRPSGVTFPEAMQKSCLRDNTQGTCLKTWDAGIPSEFVDYRAELLPELVQIACAHSPGKRRRFDSVDPPGAAAGLLYRENTAPEVNARTGLALALHRAYLGGRCPGVAALTEELKGKLRQRADADLMPSATDKR